MPIEVDERGTRALAHDLIRVVHCVRGTVELEVLCQPAFNYARSPHTVRPVQHGCVFVCDADRRYQMSLLASVPLTLKGGSANGRFRIHEGDWVGFVLE